MSLTEFKPPALIAEASGAREINARMMGNLPLDLDTTEAGFVWDLLMPVAQEAARMKQFDLQLAIKTIFHMWAEGEWLDRHAHDVGLSRRKANQAFGYVEFEGKANLFIPQGFVVAVPSDGESEVLEFATWEDCQLDGGGRGRVGALAIEGGKKYNVHADSISIMKKPLGGITRVGNPEAFTGGTEDETDDSLRRRIDDLIADRADTFVGCNADYVRWAKECDGVGAAHTIPEYHGPNSVKVVVVDADGQPANDDILREVYRYIFGTDRKDMERRAPIGLTDFCVVAPEPVPISYSFKLKLKGGYTAAQVIEGFKAAIARYYENCFDPGAGVKQVLYVKAAAVLADDVPGVADFKGFRMNGSRANIDFTEDCFPVTGEIEVLPYDS